MKRQAHLLRVLLTVIFYFKINGYLWNLMPFLKWSLLVVHQLLVNACIQMHYKKVQKDSVICSATFTELYTTALNNTGLRGYIKRTLTQS